MAFVLVVRCCGGCGDSSSDGGGMDEFIKMFASKNTWTTTLSAQQLIWSGGKVGGALRTARAANRAAQANERETAAEVRFQVRQAYYDAVYAGRLVAIAESSLDQARTHLEQVRAGRREGTRSEYELLRAEVDAANQEPGVIAARGGHDLALLNLKRLVDAPLEQPLVLLTPLAAPDGAVPVVTDLSTAVDRRPAVAAANHLVEARRLFPQAISSTKAAIVGYSGGGGNALAEDTPLLAGGGGSIGWAGFDPGAFLCPMAGADQRRGRESLPGRGGEFLGQSICPHGAKRGRDSG